MLCLMGLSGRDCVVRFQKEGSHSYLSAEQEQRNTGRTPVPSHSSGIQDSVCWRNMTDTPPDRVIKKTVSYGNSETFLSSDFLKLLTVIDVVGMFS